MPDHGVEQRIAPQQLAGQRVAAQAERHIVHVDQLEAAGADHSSKQAPRSFGLGCRYPSCSIIDLHFAEVGEQAGNALSSTHITCNAL